MALNKVTYVDNVTVIGATNLNAIQDEIIANGTSISTLSSGKVDKVTGKGLSTNDFTGEMLSKLNGVSNGANASDIAYDSTNRKLTKTVDGVTSDVVTVDAEPTKNSENLITSGGVEAELSPVKERTASEPFIALRNIYFAPNTVLADGAIYLEGNVMTNRMGSNAANPYLFVLSGTFRSLISTIANYVAQDDDLIPVTIFGGRKIMVSASQVRTNAETGQRPNCRFYLLEYIVDGETATKKTNYKFVDLGNETIYSSKIITFDSDTTHFVPIVYYNRRTNGCENVVTYRLDVIPEDDENPQSLIAPTESSMVATRPYSENDLLIVNNNLYKVIEPIVNGGSITPGTNVTATTIGAVLTSLLNA